MFNRKTTALFLLMATMVFLLGLSVVSATGDNGTVIQDDAYSGIDQSIADDNSDKLNEKYDNNVDNSLKANYNTKQSITTVTTEPTSTDRKIKITAEVKNSSGVRIKNSSFKLYYNNHLIKTISTGSGLTRYYYTVPGIAEKATIKAVYQGNSIYSSSSASYTNYVSKQNTRTTLKVEPTSVYNQVKITAEVRDKNNNLVPNSQFKVYCDGKLIKSIGTRSGITRFDYNLPNTSGDVTIKSEYQGTTVYKTSSAKYVGSPRKQNTKTTLKVEPTSVYNQVKITAVVRDDNHNLVPNSQFKVYCNDNLIKSIGTRSGITSFYYNLPYSYSGVIIKSEYQGSTLYKASSAQYAGNPRKQNTYTYLSLEPTSVNNQIKITAEVKDNNNNLVPNSQFKVYYNGNLIKSIGTRSGITKFYYTAPYTYSDITIKVEYQGSANYYSSYDTYYGKFPQKEQTYTYLTVSKADSNKICLTAQVKDTNNNPVKNSKFNLYFDGKLITTIGTSSGITKYYYTIPQQYNNYATISAKYIGNNLYKTSEDSEQIYVPDYIIKSTNTIVTASATNVNTILIKATVTDDEGYLLQNSIIDLYCNGNFIKSIKSTTGKLEYTHVLPNLLSDITIKAVYKGSNGYKSSSDSDSLKIDITALDNKITYYDSCHGCGRSVKWTQEFYDLSETGTTVQINGETYVEYCALFMHMQSDCYSSLHVSRNPYNYVTISRQDHNQKTYYMYV